MFPFFITTVARSKIDYRKLPIDKRASEIVELIELWPKSASELDVWIIRDGEKFVRNAGDILGQYGHI